MRWGARLGTRLGAGALLAISLVAFLGGWTQPFELLSQFRVQYAFTAGLAAVLAWGLRDRAVLAASIGALAINAAAIGLVVAGGAPQASRPPASEELRIVWANLYRKPEALRALAAYARARNADVVALTEVPANGDALIHAAFPDFKCVIPAPADGNPFAVAIAARAPCPSRSGDVNARFADIGGVRLVAVHARPPWDNARTRERNAAIRAAFDHATGRPDSLVIGDFNATPWSPVFSHGTGGLRRANCGLPWRPTWRSTNPLFGLPLDQAFVTRSLSVTGCEIGPDIGSDHRPLSLSITAP